MENAKPPFAFYRGVVEDNDDPLKIGRVRVRVLGVHSHNKQKSDVDGVPTEELPWAEPCVPLAGLVSGQGVSAVPSKGSWVWVFFEMGDFQSPVYIGSVVGVNEEKPSPNFGFSDPDGVYPLDDMIGESDISRLARGESIEKTVVEQKRASRATGVSAFGKIWDEPEPPYGAQYPENIVFEWGGNVVEVDRTPGRERIHIYHTSGSFTEFHPNGDCVRKTKKDAIEIVEGDEKVLVRGASCVTVSGDRNDEVGGGQKRKTGGSLTEEVGGNVTRTAGGSVTERASSITVEVSGSATVKASTVKVDAGKIELGAGGAGVVTGAHLCHYTKKPHGFYSTTVTAAP